MSYTGDGQHSREGDSADGARERLRVHSRMG
jgi:hypothetical protein